jgi:hypothetical protein
VECQKQFGWLWSVSANPFGIEQQAFAPSGTRKFTIPPKTAKNHPGYMRLSSESRYDPGAIRANPAQMRDVHETQN